jgi:hypothetical protein
LAGFKHLKIHKLKGDIMRQEHLINKINRLIPIAKATPMSEFYDDDSTGIWIKGSEYLYKGTLSYDRLLFESYLDDEAIHPDLLEIIEDAGWYGEPYDAGTLMLYPN